MKINEGIIDHSDLTGMKRAQFEKIDEIFNPAFKELYKLKIKGYFNLTREKETKFLTYYCFSLIEMFFEGSIDHLLTEEKDYTIRSPQEELSFEIDKYLMNCDGEDRKQFHNNFLRKRNIDTDNYESINNLTDDIALLYLYEVKKEQFIKFGYFGDKNHMD